MSNTADKDVVRYMPVNTRIDKNITDNYIQLRQFGQDATLIKSIMFYMAYKQQATTLFSDGNLILDVDEFCKLFNFKRENVVAKHPQPKYYEKLSSQELNRRLAVNPFDLPPEERLLDSCIENALYKLYSENLIFGTQGRTYHTANGDKNEAVTLDRIIFFESLEVRYITSKAGRKKIVYVVKLNDSFIKNISLYFLNIDLNRYPELRKSNCDDLYIYLKNLKQTLASQQQVETDSIPFEKLCEIAVIEIAEPKYRKKKLIQKFKMLALKGDFHVELSFKKTRGQRFAYTPVIKFPDLDFSKETTELLQKERIKQRTQIYFNNFIRFMSERIRIHYPNQFPEIFSDDPTTALIKYCRWDGDSDGKKEVFMKAQHESFISISNDYKILAKHIPVRLLTVKTKNDIFTVIMGKQVPFTP